MQLRILSNLASCPIYIILSKPVDFVHAVNHQEASARLWSRNDDLCASACPPERPSYNVLAEQHHLARVNGGTSQWRVPMTSVQSATSCRHLGRRRTTIVPVTRSSRNWPRRHGRRRAATGIRTPGRLKLLRDAPCRPDGTSPLPYRGGSCGRMHHAIVQILRSELDGQTYLAMELLSAADSTN